MQLFIIIIYKKLKKKQKKKKRKKKKATEPFFSTLRRVGMLSAFLYGVFFIFWACVTLFFLIYVLFV